MSDMKIGVVGAAGRMGQILIRQIHETPGAVLGGATENDGHPAVGKDASQLAGLEPQKVLIHTDAERLFQDVDAVLEFTIPAATRKHAAIAAKLGKIHVIGTTGLTESDDAEIRAAAESAIIVRSANMSLGVNLLMQLTRQVAASLDEDFDIEIVEMHHRHKIDAPSGTALALGEAAADGRGVAHDSVRDSGRDGITGARKRGDIGYAVLRGGNVVGEHNVVFAADNERITLGHIAQDRAIFARGAVRAALWAADRKPGLYSLADVLGF